MDTIPSVTSRLASATQGTLSPVLATIPRRVRPNAYNDPALSPDEKKKALEVWEQDARQLLTASNEGMPGAEEGLDPKDHHRLGEVVRAKDAIGASPTHKPAH